MTGISNDVEGLRDAIRAVHDDIGAGLDISGDGSTGGRVVPIKSIEVTRLSPSTALAIATFNYVISNSPSAPGDTEFTDIRYEVTEMRVPVYRSITDENGSEVGYDADGLPAGRIMGCNSYTRTEGSTQSTYWSGRPISYQFSKTAVQIIVYGISNSPPSVDYVNANKKLNGASNTIGGITFSAGTLRLDGLKAERIVQYDGTDGTQSYRYVYAAYYTAAENFKH